MIDPPVGRPIALIPASQSVSQPAGDGAVQTESRSACLRLFKLLVLFSPVMSSATRYRVCSHSEVVERRTRVSALGPCVGWVGDPPPPPTQYRESQTIYRSRSPHAPGTTHSADTSCSVVHGTLRMTRQGLRFCLAEDRSCFPSVVSPLPCLYISNSHQCGIFWTTTRGTNCCDWSGGRVGGLSHPRPTSHPSLPPD